MDIAVDLHIHSALSPCANDNMTPNNIVNMAILKNLDAISITDHNSCDNVEAAVNVAGSRLLVIPGMEIETREEVHLLCYFSQLGELLDFGSLIRSKLPKTPNVPSVFGNQLIVDQEDRIIGHREELLISSVDMSIDQAVDEVISRNGVLIPAHTNKPSYSVISQLGFLPKNLSKGMVEIIRNKDPLPFECPPNKCLYSSDAHELWQILERENFLSVEGLSPGNILCRLRGDS